jgi:hypothetical protein
MFDDQSSGRAGAAPLMAPVTGPIPVSEAASRLARLGFLLVNGSAPSAPGGAQLIVALRDVPTLVHFDPEIVQHWQLSQGKGVIVDLARSTPMPVHHPFSWGTIRTTDRLDVYNSFLTFGGEVTADRVDDHQIIFVYRSPGPIARWTGHSQEAEPLAGEIGAFFARIKIPIEETPEVEARVGGEPPAVLYAAFLAFTEQRRAAAHRADPALVDDALAHLLAGEAIRVRDGDRAAWSSGSELVADLRLA